MSFRASIFGALFLTAAVAAQGERVVAWIDGRHDEPMSSEGRLGWVHASDRVKVGVAAARIEPDASSKYYGITLYDVPTHGAKSLAVIAFLEGEAESSWRIRIDDESGRDAAKESAIQYATFRPGWNQIPLALEGLKSEGGRVLSVAKALRRVQISRKADSGAPALVLDGIVAPSPAAPANARALAAEIANEKDGSKRARILREKVDDLAPADIGELSLRLLQTDEHPRVRRAAREAAARVGLPAVATSFADAGLKATGQVRIDLLWTFAAMPLRAARERAFTLVREAKAASDRTALLNGLALNGGSDVGELADALPTNGAWAPRAALVHDLRLAGDRAAVDRLIAILADPGSARVADDTEDALVTLTGNDLLGNNATAWKDWWTVNREKVEVTGKGRRKVSSYASTTFYGITVPKGRIAFVLDTSGSMNEPVGGGKLAEYMKSAHHLSPTGIRTRLDLAAAELVHAVLELKEGSYVGVVSYSANETWVTKGFEKVEPTLRERIAQRVKSETAARSTNVYAGMFAAFHPEKKPSEEDLVNGPDTIFVLSDGNPSSGKYRDLEELRDEILGWNLGRAIKINTVNVGDADARLLRGLANATGGTALDLQSARKEDEKDRPRD